MHLDLTRGTNTDVQVAFSLFQKWLDFFLRLLLDFFLRLLLLLYHTQRENKLLTQGKNNVFQYIFSKPYD